jgi:hypothetical protein
VPAPFLLLCVAPSLTGVAVREASDTTPSLPEVGVEPTRGLKAPPDFESGASANFTTPASWLARKYPKMLPAGARSVKERGRRQFNLQYLASFRGKMDDTFNQGLLAKALEQGQTQGKH